ncbi:two-component sensor histidine kinase [Desulfonema ishimotonii]|uniref:histidine kinase n=1 Tax=Desulfonema ishimotonii TaxID=45657 RepID=A0A401FUA3_9BACT|nr:PAS domain-containing sensor histidine kinase [Desulfonema ishimotonii]GBC60549.1 two-component sensor histidine kinase [Desulfonema ishimotonii]
MTEAYYKSIRKNILLSMILVPAIPFIISLGIGYYYFTASLENSTIATMKRIVEDHRHMIESFLTERTDDLEFILQSYTYEQLSRPDTLTRVFENLQARSAAFVDLGIFDQQGRHVAYHGPYALEWKVYRDEIWFREVMKQGYYISDIFLGYRKVPHFVIAVTRQGNDRKWVIRATIDTQIFNALVEAVRIGRTGEAYLLNAEGVLQTRRRSGGDLMEKPADLIEYPRSGEKNRTFIRNDTSGEAYLCITTWLRDKKWLLVVRQEKADAFNALRSAIYGILLIWLIGLGVIVGVAFYVTSRIVSRMKEMDSEKEQLGQQLIRAQRLAELGEMAAGFAHEINNPLQIIKSEQTLISMNFSELRDGGELKPSDTLAELADSMAQIDLQIERCAGITQAILRFGRQSEPKLQDVDLRAFIPQVMDMVAKKASVSGIAVTRKIAEDTPPVHGDPGQLQQVLLNLFNNAMDAIISKNGSSGGRLHISSGRKNDCNVEIQIRDNGCGINPEDLKKVFSPFFTTKPVGKGTGLGLSVCYGIIDKMGGEMAASSEEGQGTVFTIHLPAAV